MVLQVIKQVAQEAIPTVVDEQAVELVLDRDELRVIPDTDPRLEPLQRRVHRHDICVGYEWRALPGGARLECRPDAVDLAHHVGRERRNARLLPRLDLDEAILLQPPERLPDRRAADP